MGSFVQVMAEVLKKLNIVEQRQFSKTPLFLVYFSIELRRQKTKDKSIKDQKNFCFNALFKVFSNFASAYSKI